MLKPPQNEVGLWVSSCVPASHVLMELIHIDHIERNVEDACTDVVQGNQQLEKGVRLKVRKSYMCICRSFY